MRIRAGISAATAKRSRCPQPGQLTLKNDGETEEGWVMLRAFPQSYSIDTPARPPLPPSPPLPPHTPPPGGRGGKKANFFFCFCSLPPLPGWGGVRRERRAGEVRGPTARTRFNWRRQRDRRGG